MGLLKKVIRGGKDFLLGGPILGGTKNLLDLGGVDLGNLTSQQRDQITQIAPWIEQQPYLRDLFSRSQGFLNAGGTPIAGFDPLQVQGQQSAINYATGNQYRAQPFPDHSIMGGPLGRFSGGNRYTTMPVGDHFGGRFGRRMQIQNPGMQPYQGVSHTPSQQQYTPGGLPGLVGSSQQAFQGAVNPLSNPYLQQAGQGLQTAQGTFGGIAGQNPQITARTPTIGGPTQAINQMLSARPNMDVWGPVMDEVSRRPLQTLREQILPSIRSGAQSAGQYGGSRQGIAEGIASRGIGEAITGQLAGLGQQAASEALAQRGLGAQLASGLAGQQAGLDLSAQQLGEQQRARQVGEQLQAAGGLGGLFSNIYSPTVGAASSALGQAGNIAQLGLLPSQIMQGIGGQRQALQQRQFDQPLRNLLGYQQLIGGNLGQQQTQQLFNNPLLSGLGGGLMGYQFGGPWGAAIGGGLGLLGGMM